MDEEGFGRVVMRYRPPVFAASRALLQFPTSPPRTPEE